MYKKIGVVEQKDQFNRDFETDRCMKKAGFIQYNTSYPLEDAFADERYRNLPACQPDAIIPTPSVERRLNSWYCKVKTDCDYCLKNALAPQLCNPENTKNPLPECLADGQMQSQASPTSSSTQNTQKSSTYIAPSRAQQQATELQNTTQNQNNRQMNNMLKNTVPKTQR